MMQSPAANDWVDLIENVIQFIFIRLVILQVFILMTRNSWYWKSYPFDYFQSNEKHSKYARYKRIASLETSNFFRRNTTTRAALA